MTVYADTNFFTNILVDLPQSQRADALLSGYRELAFFPLPVPQILCLEVINALQRLLFDARRGAQEIRMTPELALSAEERFLHALDLGAKWRLYEVDPAVLQATFSGMVYRHTADHGFRTYDILHVSFAVVLGCDTFWSFDKRAKKLAVLEGLKTND